jgi:hypothetical protein
MLLFLTVVLVPMTHAAEEVAGRNVGHAQKTEMMEVGDVPGHVMGVTQFSGLSFYTRGPEKGEVVARGGTLIFDLVKGKGTLSGYETKTFKDGSTMIFKFVGNQTPMEQGKKAMLEGTWEVAGGTGKYAGAKGSGTWKGEKIGDVKTGGDNYVDFTGSYTMK